MWIMLNDAFFSIVHKDCERDEVMVRARRPGDIEKVFPELEGKVQEFTASDYHYRAAIKRVRVARAMVEELARVVYPNFKSSVADHQLHDAYMQVWTAMADLQPNKPYSGRRRSQRDFEWSALPRLMRDRVANFNSDIKKLSPPKSKRKPKNGK